MTFFKHVSMVKSNGQALHPLSGLCCESKEKSLSSCLGLDRDLDAIWTNRAKLSRYSNNPILLYSFYGFSVASGPKRQITTGSGLDCRRGQRQRFFLLSHCVRPQPILVGAVLGVSHANECAA